MISANDDVRFKKVLLHFFQLISSFILFISPVFCLHLVCWTDSTKIIESSKSCANFCQTVDSFNGTILRGVSLLSSLVDWLLRPKGLLWSLQELWWFDSGSCKTAARRRSVTKGRQDCSDCCNCSSNSWRQTAPAEADELLQQHQRDWTTTHQSCKERYNYVHYVSNMSCSLRKSLTTSRFSRSCIKFQELLLGKISYAISVSQPDGGKMQNENQFFCSNDSNSTYVLFWCSQQ